MPLVHYASSDDEAEPAVASPVARKRRKLPPLPPTYAAHADDPAQHQGRRRARPFVEGEYYAHVYLALDIPPALRPALAALLAAARAGLAAAPDEPAEWNSSAGASRVELVNIPLDKLHVSLTHPLPLRRDQASELSAALARALRRTPGFRLSLAGVAAYRNGAAHGGDGAGGRAFLSLRVGAGAAELESMLERAIHPLLARFHLPLYHADPQFHTSIAWCLLPASADGANGSRAGADAAGDDAPDLAADDSPLAPLVPVLDRDHGPRIVKHQPAGGWAVSSVLLKVAKTVTTIPLM